MQIVAKGGGGHGVSGTILWNQEIVPICRLLNLPRKWWRLTITIKLSLRVSREIDIRGMFEMNCLFLSGDFKFQVSPKVLISCPRSTPRG